MQGSTYGQRRCKEVYVAHVDVQSELSIFGGFDVMKYIVGISEIVLWTADTERSLKFYRDLLGLEVISPPTLPNVFLKVGEGNAGIPQMIVLVPKSEMVKAAPFGYQLHHMALELPEEAFDTQYEVFVAAGYEPRDGKHPVLASRTMYIDDPDGNEVEFICRSSAE